MTPDIIPKFNFGTITHLKLDETQKVSPISPNKIWYLSLETWKRLAVVYRVL